MNTKRGKCFVDKKACREDCVLYRKGVRLYGDQREPTPFEECALNIMADCLEQMVARTAGLQAEQNKVANALTGFTDLVKVAQDKRISHGT